MNSATWNSQPDACAATTAGAQGPDRITRTGYDAVGRVETVTTGYGVDPIVATAATFTDNGRLATLTDGEGNRTTYEYDGYDRLVKARYPSKTVAGTSSTTDYEQFLLDDKGHGRAHVRTPVTNAPLECRLLIEK